MNISSSVFQNALLYSSFGIAIIGGSGVIRLSNHSLQNLSGRTEAELEGSMLEELFHPEDRHIFRSGIETIKRGKKSSLIKELRFLSKTGELWAKLRLTLVPHPDKDSWVLTACIEDISVHYNLIKQLTLSSQLAEKARDEAEKATKTKSEFLANTSHEIRTPIHTIIGMTELMLDTALDPEQQEYAEQVQFSADVLLSLINDILDFEKIEAGKLKLEAIEIGLYEILANAMDLVVLEGHRKGLEMILDIAPDVPDRIKGDPVRLRQILVNLINNAIKFTASGEIHLMVKIAEVTDDYTVIHFTVRDTGIGISEEKKSKLFKEFSQIDSSTTRKYGGTGLGLSISKKLSEMMNGKIGVESREGEGASFWFTAEFKVLDDDDRLYCRDKFTEHSILIVDDNEHSSKVLQNYVEEWGCRSEVCSCGETALKRLKEAIREGTPFNSCFVDLVMPRMDGWHFANEVKTSEELKETSLFLLSPAGQGTIEPKMKLLNWFSAYLDKPIKKQKLFIAYFNRWGEGEFAGGSDVLSAAVSDEEATLSNGNILVAEDHEVNQQLFKTILENQGQTVVIANNGLEAVEAVSREKFDIIFMDVQMPEMNGYEATIKIRESGVDTPIIAVTASAIKGEKDKCISVGMTDFLTKPFKKKDITPVLYKYVGDTIGTLEEVEELEPLEGFEAEDDTSVVLSGAPEEEGSFSGDMSEDPLDIFDLDEALDTFMGKRELVFKLLNTQVEKVCGQIPVMEEALAAEEWDILRESAHSIKGGSWNLQAKQIGDCAAEAEAAAKNADGVAADRALYRVKEAFRRFKNRVEEVLSEDS